MLRSSLLSLGHPFIYLTLNFVVSRNVTIAFSSCISLLERNNSDFYGLPFIKLSNHSEQAKLCLLFKVRAGNFVEQIPV